MWWWQSMISDIFKQVMEGLVCILKDFQCNLEMIERVVRKESFVLVILLLLG